MATRQLVVEIVGDADSLTRTFTKASSATHKFGRDISETDRSLTKVTRGAIAGSGAFRGLGQSIAFASGSFLGAAGFAAIVRQSIGLASDLNEQLNKVRVVFRSGAADVIAFSKTSTNALAITQDEALATAGVFGNMLVPMGFARKEAAGMSIQLVKLAADMASFNNADPSVVLDALRSGLAGEVEPLRRFGVQLSDARERAVLTAAGMKNLGGTLTAQQRSWAAYQLILHDTADAQGDFARTSHGLANQQRILRAQLQQMEAQIGQGLLPAVLHITRGLTNWLGKTENQRLVQRKANEAIHTAGEVFRGLGHALKITGGIIHQVDRVTGSLTNTMEILIGLKLASMFRGWSRNMAIFGATTQTAGIRAKGLLATMRTLSATPFIITIAFVFTENDMKERAKAFVQNG